MKTVLVRDQPLSANGGEAPPPPRHKRPKAAVPAELTLRGVTKVHGKGESAVVALDEISLTLPAGSFTTIMGPSGSGKSTFLHVAAGLDRPDEGAVTFGDT